jgi:hypothetical protein
MYAYPYDIGAQVDLSIIPLLSLLLPATLTLTHATVTCNAHAHAHAHDSISLSLSLSLSQTHTHTGGGMVLKAGERRGYMVLSSSARGVALRAKHQDAWQAGEESERDEHLIIRTGLLPCRWQDLSTTALHHVYHPQNAAAFVGIVDYRVLD